MILPNRIFFTGVPGSRWSGIAQHLESLFGFNTSDRTQARDYSHHRFTGHKGAYFGRGMEFDHDLNTSNIDAAHATHEGTRLIKSHDWAYVLDEIKQKFPNDWIMLVYRPDLVSYAWWHEAGGFQIEYPNYKSYGDSINMLSEISKQNKAILEYAYEQRATWHYFTDEWILDTFGKDIKLDKVFNDILVTVIK